MKSLSFIADNAADALGRISSSLGPEAVVLSVTPIPASGMARFWRKPRLQVTAGLPESLPLERDGAEEARWLAAKVDEHEDVHEAGQVQAAPQCRPARAYSGGFRPAHQSCTAANLPDDFHAQAPLPRGNSWNIDALRHFTRPSVRPGAANDPVPRVRADAEMAGPNPPAPAQRWRSAALLQRMGLQPLQVELVLERARSVHGSTPPAAFAQEFALVRETLFSFWRPAPDRARTPAPPIHIFIGPPGSGKTTALCKWLADFVLIEGRSARAWRLDSRDAHAGRLLDYYGAYLGVPVAPDWSEPRTPAGFDAGFVDVPGINSLDPAALEQWHDRLQAIPGAEWHLVLNAAYETPVLLAQARAFSALPIRDLIFTHLDEERRPAKLWNFLVGTDYTVRALTSGQNIPGGFAVATPEALIS
jgi:flagellar biosynthesis GTPase FlhF